MRQPPLTSSTSYQALHNHAAKARDWQMRDLFAADPQRFERLSSEAAGLFLDYSKNRLDGRTLELLKALAQERGVERLRDAMFNGDKINLTENRAVLHTNVLGAHAQCEAAMKVFRAQGAGHLVLISSVASIRGMKETRTAYGASKAAVNALAEGIRSDVWGTGIVVTTILPGYIATDINVGRRGPFTVDLDKGVDALTAAVEREPVKAFLPPWPWRPIARLLRVLPLSVVRRVT